MDLGGNFPARIQSNSGQNGGSLYDQMRFTDEIFMHNFTPQRPNKIPQHGFLRQYQRRYVRSSKETIADKELNNVAFPFAPVTPDHHHNKQQMHENQHPGSANLEESATHPDPPKEDNNQIELAQQKARRRRRRSRKHRPRVVKEGTAKKAAKPTVEQAGTAATEMRPRKRRKNNSIQTSQTPPPDEVGEIGDKMPRATTTRSCKRALNFICEEEQAAAAVDGSHVLLHFPEIYKKRRTKRAQNTIRANSKRYDSYMSCSYRAGSALKNGNSKSTENNLNNQIGASSMHYMQSQTVGMTCSMQGIPNILPSHNHVQTDTNVNRSQTSELMLSLAQIEMNTKKMAEQKNKELATVRSVSYSASPRRNCQALATYKGPVEEAAQNFNSHVHGQIVPYEGLLFDPAKKRRPRPKVDLDPETDKVWKLLMYKGGIHDNEHAYKEKLWEEERRIFRGRVDSFIARMHFIQGDRRFSQWNGSVLDSVVGVFLTQNVSDHLSSSAFMALAARFPLKSTSNNLRSNDNMGSVQVEEPEVANIEPDDDVGCQAKISTGPISDQDSTTFSGAECAEEKRTVHERDLLGNTEWGSWEGISQLSRVSPENGADNFKVWKGNQTSNVADTETQEDIVSWRTSCIWPQNSETSDETMNMALGTSSVIDCDDKRTMDDDAGSSQKPVSLSLLVTNENVKSCSDSNSEGEDPTRNNFRGYFKGLLQIVCTKSQPLPEEFSSQGSDNLMLDLNSTCDQSQPDSLTSGYHFNSARDSGELKLNYHEVMGAGNNNVSTLPTNITRGEHGDRIGLIKETRNEITMQQKVPSNSAAAHAAHQDLPSTEQHEPPLNSGQQGFLERNSISCTNLQGQSKKTLSFKEVPAKEPSSFGASSTSHIMHQENLNESNSSRESVGDVETCSEYKQRQQENKIVVSSIKGQAYDSHGLSNGTTTNTLKTRARIEKEKKAAFDWDSLRREVLLNGTKRERTMDTMDSLNWEAVRCADVNEIAKAIKERGMNNRLAERIKDFLNRLVRDHGSIDLEWLRDVAPDKTKEYLLSVRGLGLKSVECVRLLTLHHLAFPVDTNVGRTAVRLGWVPLQPLPESLQLHLLEMYPILESIQKYLWPRLCTLDQRALYELHYQMITFGKVFCTKSKPNCNACPMRAECKHFASAFASARLALPAPEQKGIVSSNVPITTSHNTFVSFNPMHQPLPLPIPEDGIPFESVSRTNNHEPIIEVPVSPESHDQCTTESDFEDTFYEEDPDEIPTIKLNIQEFALNLQNYMQANMELEEGDMSKALVALTPEAASIPTPKLKNVTRLRTEHQVYELPDSHPLLEGVEARVPNDVSSYLLAIWTPGETAESIQPPDRCCTFQTSNQLCNETTCFSCNSIREAKSQILRGTLLIPCKTAMRGSFPLNGTYFQVNEVFADHESSLNPICVPRDLIWNLPRRTVYFGTSIPTIFKGQTTAEIQNCFWRGFVCVRGFDQKTRAPRPLMARFHCPASRLLKAKAKAKANEE